MATGITIDEVTNTLDDIQGTEKIPVSSGISEPEVVTTGDLKDYINDGMQEKISDLSTIRSGASAGATAYQKPSSGIPSTDLASAVQTSLGKADTALQSFTETDPTVPSWAKQSSKPSYTAGEVGAVPTTRTVNGKSLSSNIALTASDVEALPSSTVIPDVSGFITNTVDDLVYYYTKSQTYSQTEVQQLINAVRQFTYELVSVLPAASASTMNKIYLVPSSDPQTQNIKDEYITLESSGSYSWEQIGSTAIDLSDYVTAADLNTALADYTTSADLASLLEEYQTKIDSTHKLDYSLIDNTPTIPTTLSSFTDDLGNSPTHTHSQYLTSAPVTSVNGQTGAVSLSIPTESTVSGWGFTKNAGTITGVTMNGASKGTSGVVDLGTVITDVSGKQDTLVSGTNIKTINNESLLGSGNITIQGGGGQQQQADWSQTDSSAVNYIKNKPSSSGVYWGAWTATSSAAQFYQLTDKLILPEGVYIVRGQTAMASKALNFMLGLTNAYNMQSVNPQSSNMTFYNGNSFLLIFDIVFVGSGGGEVWIQTAANTSVTYTSTQRGFIAALKLV